MFRSLFLSLRGLTCSSFSPFPLSFRPSCLFSSATVPPSSGHQKAIHLEPTIHTKILKSGNWLEWTDEKEEDEEARDTLNQLDCIVAVHGMPGSVRDFRYMGPLFSERNIRIIRLQNCGYGARVLETSLSPSLIKNKISWEGQNKHIIEAIEDLYTQPVFLLGHSFGSPQVFSVAAARPDLVRGIILVNPVGLRPWALYKKTIKSLKGMTHIQKLPVPIQESVLPLIVKLFQSSGFKATMNQCVIASHLVSTFDFKKYQDDVRKVRAPVFVAWAKDDDCVEVEIVQDLISNLHDKEGPRIQFETGGHNLQKTQAKELVSEISHWITLLPDLNTGSKKKKV